MPTARKSLIILLLLFSCGAQAIEWPDFIKNVASNYTKSQILKHNLYRNASNASESSHCYRYINSSKEYNWLCVQHREDWLLRAGTIFMHLDFTPSRDSRHFCLRNQKTRQLLCYTVCIKQISHELPDKCYKYHGDVEVALLNTLDFKKVKNLRTILHARFGEDYSIR